MSKTVFSVVMLFASMVFALEPDEILVIVNSDNPESVEVGEYYRLKRAVPAENIVKVGLGQGLKNDLSREDYDNILVPAIKTALGNDETDSRIRCLVTTFGVPYRVGGRGQSIDDRESFEKIKEFRQDELAVLKGVYAQLSSINPEKQVNSNLKITSNVLVLISQTNELFQNELKRIEAIANNKMAGGQVRAFSNLYKQFYGLERWAKLPISLRGDFDGDIEEEILKHKIKLNQASSDRWDLKTIIQADYYGSFRLIFGVSGSAASLDSQVSRMEGKGSSASLDSELSMLRFETYDLYRWQVNELKNRLLWLNVKTLMVSRLDGPSAEIAKGLVDKALKAERNGFRGLACFDARGYAGNNSKGEFEKYDRSILLCAEMFRQKGWEVKVENSEKLFSKGQCPGSAIYCGWYSLRKYIPAFTFVDGAVGYHIASFEAIDLRDVESGQWVPNLLNDGITATIGAVAEPYLGAFPMPADFFTQLLRGKTLVEAYYKTKPYNSWQMLLIGDPLYKPFSI